MQFLDDSIGWICSGFQAGIRKTTDGGKTWRSMIDSFAVDVRDIQFIDAHHGWFVGDKKTGENYIGRTTDGGQTWNIDLTAKTMIDVAFTDSLDGRIGGVGGVILRTHNGGKTWETEYSGDSISHIYKIAPIDSTSAWAVANVSGQNKLLRYGKLPLSAEESPLEAKSTLSISPNPATESFTVHCPDAATVTVRDVFGRVMYAGAGGAIPTSGWAAGVYFVEAGGAHGRRTVGKVAVGR